MNARAKPNALQGSIVLLALCACLGALADEPAKPPIEQIGEQRYRIGEIVVDKERAEFTVPATVLHLDDPLEYVAVAKDGLKGYESLLELSASATEFNLACILIGLDDKASVKPRYQFDERKAEGMAVSVTLHWQDGDRQVSASAAEAMSLGDEVFTDNSWVYIGSLIDEGDGRFMADVSGALISFVHDPFAIIDHRNGAAIGAYGLLTGNNDLLPPEGATLSVTVSVAAQ